MVSLEGVYKHYTETGLPVPQVAKGWGLKPEVTIARVSSIIGYDLLYYHPDIKDAIHQKKHPFAPGYLVYMHERDQMHERIANRVALHLKKATPDQIKDIESNASAYINGFNIVPVENDPLSMDDFDWAKSARPLIEPSGAELIQSATTFTQFVQAITLSLTDRYYHLS